MMKLNKIAMMIATVAVVGSAFANGSTINSDNWRTGQGNVQWKIGNASALCWRTTNWTPATAAPGCDGAIAPAEAAPAPAAAGAIAPSQPGAAVAGVQLVVRQHKAEALPIFHCTLP